MSARSYLLGVIVLAAVVILVAGQARAARSDRITSVAQKLTPGGLVLEAAVLRVPIPGDDARALVPASLALRTRLPLGTHLALRLQSGAGALVPLAHLELGREPPASPALE